jgi:outer membrane protein OmpA-like peptidoglycan-associated protein
MFSRVFQDLVHGRGPRTALLCALGGGALLLAGCAASRAPVSAALEEFNHRERDLREMRTSSPSAEILQEGAARRDKAKALLDAGKTAKAAAEMQLALADARTAQAAAAAAEAAEEAGQCLQAVEKARRGWEEALRLLVETEQIARRQAEGVPHDAAPADLTLPALPPTLLESSAPPPAGLDLQQAWRQWSAAADTQRVATADLEVRLSVALEAAAGAKRAERERLLFLAGRTLQEMEARVRRETALGLCVQAAQVEADLSDAAGRARTGTLELERGLRADLRAELEKTRAEAEDRQKKIYEALQQIQGKYARISQDARGTIVSLADILFDFDKATLKRNVEFSLVRVATILNQFPEMKIAVEGHTDNVGRPEYNLELSQRRAQAVRDFLVTQEVQESRMTVQGYGMTRPVAGNDSEEGRSRNRRVDLVIQDQP